MWTLHAFAPALIVALALETMRPRSAQASIPLIGKMPVLFPENNAGLLSGGLGGIFGGGAQAGM